MFRKIDPDEWASAFSEIRNESDRAAGLVAASILEATLARCIEHRLLPMSGTHYEALFGDRGPLATFSSKIDLGFSLGLYGLEAKNDLHKIRSVRNQFAHYFARDFSHPKVIEICKHITEYNPNPRVDAMLREFMPEHEPHINMRWRFMFAVGTLYQGITQEGRIVKPPDPPTVLK
jgi:hypothetical protein